MILAGEVTTLGISFSYLFVWAWRDRGRREGRVFEDDDCSTEEHDVDDEGMIMTAACDNDNNISL